MYTPISKGLIVVIGVLVVSLIVMAATIGYLYGFRPAIDTQTLTLTDVETQTFTKTQTQFKTATETETVTETLIQSTTLTQTQTETQTTTKTSTTIQTTTKTVTPAYEKLIIINAYNNYTTCVTINIKNNGTADSTIAYIFLNGKPIDSNKITPSIPFVFKVGTSMQLKLDFTMAPLSYGETYDFRIRTGSGADYAIALRII